MRIWGGYLLVLMAWVVAVMALAFLGFIICASITWQPSPLYDFLNWVRDYIVLVCIVTVLAGWVVISFYFISKPIKQLDVVANAAEQLSRPSEEPIQLPDSLEDISIQLNLEFSVLCLGQIFDNLLRNASYYSLPDSTVEIAGRIEAGKIVLTFSNAGKNIPQEKLDRIFEQFFRLDSSRATRTGGAGLGLAIAKEIVELHGGTIRADSTEDRITFTICLPSDHSEAP